MCDKDVLTTLVHIYFWHLEWREPILWRKKRLSLSLRDLHLIHSFVLIWSSVSSNFFARIHPLPEATYTGVRRTPLGNMFFPSFLAKTKREQLLPGHIHGKFWPQSLQFALWNFDQFLGEDYSPRAITASELNWIWLAHHFGGYILMIFLFFASSLGPLEPE